MAKITRLQNVETGEFRDVETDGKEHKSLQGDVTQGGLEKWNQVEITSGSDEPGSDVYDLAQVDVQQVPPAVMLHLRGIAPDKNPHLVLTPGEQESGLTSQSKVEELLTQYRHLIEPHRISGGGPDARAQAAAIVGAGEGEGKEGDTEGEGNDESKGKGKKKSSSDDDSNKEGGDK